MDLNVNRIALLNRDLKMSILVLVYCIIPSLVFSQNNNFRKWSINEGLCNSVVYCISQDARGYLWMGTENGLCSFDGKKFKTYTSKDGLSGNEVRSIFQDSKGRLWIGTKGGVTIYDGYVFRKITKKDGLAGSAVLSFLEDEQHRMWAGTDDGGLNIISLDRADSVKIRNLNEKEGLSNFLILGLYEDEQHAVWAATYGGGIQIIRPEKDGFLIHAIKGKKHIPSDMLFCLSPDQEGNLWFGTADGGAFKIKIADKFGEAIAREPFNTSNGLNSNAVWKILNTKDGNTWFGTIDNGITRMFPGGSNQKEKAVSYKTGQGISGNQILSLMEDKEGDIWIGTNGDGLNMLSGDVFSHYSKSDGLPENKIQAIKQDKEGSFWMASTGGGLCKMSFPNQYPVIQSYTEKDGFPNNLTTSIALGNEFNPNVWIGTQSAGLIKFDGKHFQTLTEKDGLISNRVNSSFVDSRGILWTGSAGGISRFDGNKFEIISTATMKMTDEGIKSILEDKTGSIWFGAQGGLIRYSRTRIMRTFDAEEGLSSINVNAIAEDSRGNIWIGTNEGGIFRYNKSKPDSISIEFVADEKVLGTNSIHSLLFYDDNILIAGTNKGFDKLILDESGKIRSAKIYGFSDGFTGVECNDNAICKDKEGNIWFGTVNGVTKCALQLEKKTTTPPSVHLTSVQLFFKDVDWKTKTDSVSKWNALPENLTLPYDQNHLTFHFSGISFVNPEKTTFRYILEGRDKNWSPPNTASEITFSGISKGSYTFKVMAIDANGITSEPALFHFVITPPWYETKLFYAGSLLFVILSFYSFMKFRERKLVEENRILENIVTERTHEVVQQKEHIAEKNKEITDSITYAKRIQTSILPNVNEVRRSLPESFILFKPKDIVSGDFYWFRNVAQDAHHPAAAVYIAAADCTGHGVPGAFMSTIGVEKLNEAIKQCYHPGEVLSFINNTVKKSLQQSHEEGSENTSVNDGMDVAMLQFQFNADGAILHYAAANRPLYLIRKDSGAIEETKANKTAIGGHTEEDQVFDTHTFELNKGDTCYLSSDGYADQFGADDKKLMTRNFKNLLLQIQDKPMDEQGVLLGKYIETWRGSTEQTDDILVIGVRVT